MYIQTYKQTLKIFIIIMPVIMPNIIVIEIRNLPKKQFPQLLICPDEVFAFLCDIHCFAFSYFF